MQINEIFSHKFSFANGYIFRNRHVFYDNVDGLKTQPESSEDQRHVMKTTNERALLDYFEFFSVFVYCKGIIEIAAVQSLKPFLLKS